MYRVFFRINGRATNANTYFPRILFRYFLGGFFSKPALQKIRAFTDHSEQLKRQVHRMRSNSYLNDLLAKAIIRQIVFGKNASTDWFIGRIAGSLEVSRDDLELAFLVFRQLCGDRLTTTQINLLGNYKKHPDGHHPIVGRMYLPKYPKWMMEEVLLERCGKLIPS